MAGGPKPVRAGKKWFPYACLRKGEEKQQANENGKTYSKKRGSRCAERTLDKQEVIRVPRKGTILPLL